MEAVHEKDDFAWAQFRSWLSGFGHSAPLCLGQSVATGRGLMATRTITANSLIVSVPEKLLITRNAAQKLFPQFDLSKLDEQAALALFLTHQKMCKDSDWRPYLQMIPSHFDSMAANLPPTLLALLPKFVQAMVTKQMQTFNKDYAAVIAIVGPQDIEFSTEYRWAWFAVNSRCITLNTSQTNPTTGFKPKPKSNTPKIALAPFLDLLNHSPSAKVRANFNPITKAFEIIALETVNEGDECFISYGPHDNAFLLVEYGFVVSGVKDKSEKQEGRNENDGKFKPLRVHNPFDFVRIDLEVIGLEIDGEREGARNRVFSELEGAGLYRDYTLHLDQDSYRVINALRLYACMNSAKDFDTQLNRWRMVINGQNDMISQDNERKALGYLYGICQTLASQTRDSLKALEEWNSSELSGMQAHCVRIVLESTLNILEWNMRYCNQQLTTLK